MAVGLLTGPVFYSLSCAAPPAAPVTPDPPIQTAEPAPSVTEPPVEPSATTTPEPSPAPAPSMTPEERATLPCSDGWSNFATGVKPASPLDYFEIRRTLSFHSQGQGLPWFLSGKACATAKDVPACEAKVKGAASQEGFFVSCHPSECVHFVVATRGDEVIVAKTAAEVKALLGPIDSPSEAWLIALTHDYYVYGCDAPAKTKQEPGGSFLLEAGRTLSTCPITSELVRIRVTPSGAVQRVAVLRKDKSEACSALPSDGPPAI